MLRPKTISLGDTPRDSCSAERYAIINNGSTDSALQVLVVTMEQLTCSPVSEPESTATAIKNSCSTVRGPSLTGNRHFPTNGFLSPVAVTRFKRIGCIWRLFLESNF
ncbi:uncharacterized protein [Argopecten irradians]|uniref:uncharacterized protein n=1 Tax=Argopecten irradians TaxID=31199 RepID=UPI00370FCAA5